ncbi:hypothetical protein MHYP_G00020060 [Metynnis hypsauchen]
MQYLTNTQCHAYWPFLRPEISLTPPNTHTPVYNPLISTLYDPDSRSASLRAQGICLSSRALTVMLKWECIAVNACRRFTAKRSGIDLPLTRCERNEAVSRPAGADFMCPQQTDNKPTTHGTSPLPPTTSRTPTEITEPRTVERSAAVGATDTGSCSRLAQLLTVMAAGSDQGFEG